MSPEQMFFDFPEAPLPPSAPPGFSAPPQITQPPLPLLKSASYKIFLLQDRTLFNRSPFSRCFKELGLDKYRLSVRFVQTLDPLLEFLSRHGLFFSLKPALLLLLPPLPSDPEKKQVFTSFTSYYRIFSVAFPDRKLFW